MSILCQNNIGGLDIPVDNPVFMQETQYIANFLSDHPALFFRQFHAAHRLSLDIFLHNGGTVSCKRYLVYRRQIRMGYLL